MKQQGCHDIDGKDYAKKVSYLSPSKVMVALNAARFNYVYNERENYKKKQENLNKGTFLHYAVLEPQKLNDYTTKFESKISRDWFWWKERALLNLSKHYDAKWALEAESSVFEGSLFLRDEITGFDLKVKPDILNTSAHVIYNLKTSTSVNKSKFKKSVRELNYDATAAMECYVYFRCYGVWPQYKWIVVGTQAYAPVAVYEASKETMKQGDTEFRQALDNIRNGKENQWRYQTATEFI